MATTGDEQGRVRIPVEMRDALGIEPGGTVEVTLRNEEVVIHPRISREEFVETMESCITEETARGDGVEVDPLDPLGLDDPTGADE